MMKMKHNIWLTGMLFALCLASCGDFWDGGAPVAARKMTLGRQVVDLMVGDHFNIPVFFEPDELSNHSVWWTVDDTDIATMDDNTLIAVNEGTTTVWAMSVSDRQEASCIVNVWPRWYENRRSYPYDMVIYANITLNGEPIDESIYVGAFINGELRGVAKRYEDSGRMITYIRVWDDMMFGNVIYLKFYNPEIASMVEVNDFWMPFNGNSVGLPSSPIDIELE